MKNISGSCHCGAVSYRYPAPPLQVVSCHCGLCRRMTGAALAVYVVVKAADLQIAQGTEGQGSLRSYAVNDHTSRHFCRLCASPIYNSNTRDYAGLAMLYLGSVDEHEQFSPRMALYCDNRLPWLPLPDNCQHHQQGPQRPEK